MRCTGSPTDHYVKRRPKEAWAPWLQLLKRLGWLIGRSNSRASADGTAVATGGPGPRMVAGSLGSQGRINRLRRRRAVGTAHVYVAGIRG